MNGGPKDALTALARELREERSVISGHVVEPADPAQLGILVAAGPRAARAEESYAAVIECVREGYLLHYSRPRLLGPVDPDLALLAGDYLYAKGLERLAGLGDLAAVRELSDLISLSAQLHADSGAEVEQAGGLWLASAVAVAAGPTEGHERAKAALRKGSGVEGLYAHAREVAAEAGLGEQLAEAAETVGFSAPHRG